MALQTLQVTLGAGATQITATRTPCNQILFGRDAATYYIGTSNVDSTHGIPVKTTDADNPSIGPFSAVAPIDAAEIYLSGTQGHVIQIILITF